MLPSFVSYHNEFNGTVIAGASSCLNINGIESCAVLLLVTVDDKLVIDVALAVLAVEFAVIAVSALLIDCVLVAILPSNVAVQTFGVPATNIYILLSSLLSNHIEPVGLSADGSASCLNVKGLLFTAVVNVVTSLDDAKSVFVVVVNISLAKASVKVPAPVALL